MHILLAENDERTISQISLALKAEHFVVDVVSESKLMKEVLSVQEFDLILLSHNMQEPSSMDILRDYIDNGGVQPVVFMLQREDYKLGIDALEEGASDFILKPLIIRELIARLRANIRTFRRYQNRLLTLGPIKFDTISKNVWLDEENLPLTRREKAVLEVLLRFPDQFLTKEKIISSLFSMSEEVTLSAIQTYVHRIRHKIQHPRIMIKTVWGAGYKIELIEDEHTNLYKLVKENKS